MKPVQDMTVDELYERARMTGEAAVLADAMGRSDSAEILSLQGMIFSLLGDVKELRQRVKELEEAVNS